MNTTIGELAVEGVLSFGDGYRTRRDQLGRPGYRILRVADVADGAVSRTGPDFVSDEFTTQIRSKLSEPGDVLLTTKGTVGRVAEMPGGERVVYSPQLCYFRVHDEGKLCRRFLSLWFRSADFAHQASHRANNTDMAPYINLADIRSLAINLPPLEVQQGIAEVLGAFDDKIAANRAVADQADILAQAAFARDSANGERTPVSSLARFVNGRAFTKNATGTGRVVIRIAELNGGIGGSTVRNDIDVDDDNTARPGDLLFAWSGSLTVARWFRDEAIINQHIFKVVADKGYPLWLVNQAVLSKLAEYQAVAADKATTMGHIQRRHLDESVLVPRLESITCMGTLMQALWDRALAAEMEAEYLAEARDELLPLLMSGRLTVKDAEKRAEEVL